MLTIFLIPARFYYKGNHVTATAVIMILIFSLAYLYIIGESVYLAIKEKNAFTKHMVKINGKQMLCQYIKCACMVTMFSTAVKLAAPQFYAFNKELMMIVNMVVVLLCCDIKFLDKPLPLICLSLLTILFIFAANAARLGVNLTIYPVVLPVLLLRFFAERYNYKTIPTADAEKGMVLSYATVVSFAPSAVKGLPTQTTEDIRSRLSEEEADSIRRWATSKYGQPTITIVRKIPFAIFISGGTAVYTLIRMLIRL